MSIKSATTEILRRRRDIPDTEVEALVERAAQLQEQEQATQENHATAAEIADVAAELDIDPRYVEQAIQSWRAEASSGPIHPPSERILARRKTAIRVVFGFFGIALLAMGLLTWLLF